MFHTVFRDYRGSQTCSQRGVFDKPPEVDLAALASPRLGSALDLVEGTPETFAGDGMSLRVSFRSTDLSSLPPWERPATVHDVGGEENMRLLELSNTE